MLLAAAVYVRHKPGRGRADASGRRRGDTDPGAEAGRRGRRAEAVGGTRGDAGRDPPVLPGYLHHPP